MSADLPPLTDAQCARVAALLSTAKPTEPKQPPVRQNPRRQRKNR